MSGFIEKNAIKNNDAHKEEVIMKEQKKIAFKNKTKKSVLSSYILTATKFLSIFHCYVYRKIFLSFMNLLIFYVMNILLKRNKTKKKKKENLVTELAEKSRA